MSQDELARMLGYKSRSSINKIEKGENDIPQSKIVAFAGALKTTPEYLMGWESAGKKFRIAKSIEEEELLDGFNSLSADGRITLLNILNSLRVTHSAHGITTRVTAEMCGKI